MSRKRFLAITCLAGLPFLVAQAPATPGTMQPPAAVAPTLTPPPLPTTPVPPPLPPEAQFFYNNGGTPQGPVGLAELQAKAMTGAIGPSTLIWKAGTPGWISAKDLPELANNVATLNQTPDKPQIRAANSDIRTFLCGTWETEGPGPAGTQGPAKMVLTLGQSGNVTGTYSVHLAGSGATASIPVTGTWNAVPLSDKQANLTLGLLVYGNDGQQHAVNSTAALEIVDHDTVRDVNQGTISKRVGGEPAAAEAG